MIKDLRKAFILFAYILLCICIINNVSIIANENIQPQTQKEIQPQTYVKLQQNIVFVKSYWIYYLPANSDQPVKIVQGTIPNLTPDGKSIVYSVIKPDDNDLLYNSGINIINIDTKETKTIIPDTIIISDFILSPDGNLIAYLNSDNVTKADQLYISKLDGTDNKLLITGSQSNNKNNSLPQKIQSINWTADSKSIVFHDRDYIYQVNLNGEIIKKQDVEALGVKKASSRDIFSYSPVNSEIMVYTKYPPDNTMIEAYFYKPTSLYIYNFKTKQSKRLTPPGLLAQWPVWSTDGNYIFFEGADKNFQQNKSIYLYRINNDGNGLLQIGQGNSIGFAKASK